MKIIKVKVREKDLGRFRILLKKHGFQEDQNKQEEDFSDAYITTLSEVSLREEWDSKEDERYKKYFHQEP